MKTSVNVQGKFTHKTQVDQDQAPLTVTDLGPFDNNRNDIVALNDVGQAAGVSLNPGTGRIEAFLQENGDALHWVRWEARSASPAALTIAEK